MLGNGTYKVYNSMQVTLYIPVTKDLTTQVLLVPDFRQFSLRLLAASRLKRALWQWDILHLLVFRKQREDTERG